VEKYKTVRAYLEDGRTVSRARSHLTNRGREERDAGKKPRIAQSRSQQLTLTTTNDERDLDMNLFGKRRKKGGRLAPIGREPTRKQVANTIKFVTNPKRHKEVQGTISSVGSSNVVNFTLEKEKVSRF